MVKKLLIAASFFFITLVLAELMVRTLFPHWAPRTPRLAQFWQHDERYGWSHIPGARGRFKSYGFDVQVEINAQGFRGPAIAPAKDASKTRVLVVGDSLVWGFGVEQEEIFTSKMAAQCQDLEVINFGVSGYSTDQELLLFKEQGKALKPDVVVLVVSGNDFDDNTRSTVNVYYQKPLFLLEDGRLVLSNRPVPAPNIFIETVSLLARQSYLLTQMGRTIQGLAIAWQAGPAANRDGARAQSRTSRFLRSKAAKVTALLIQQFLQEVEAAGAEPAVVFGDWRGHHISAFLGLETVTVVQLEGVTLDPDPERYHLPGDFHWNPAGHDLVAQRLLDALIEAGTLEPCKA